MRQIKNITLASLAGVATLASAGTTHAAAFGPFSVGVGVLRATNSVLQNQTGASNATSYLTIQRCSGVIETPVFVAAGASCTATTADYQIIMDVLSPTSTRVTIVATSATCDIRYVRFGTPNSRCAYDMTNPNPGTVGSGAGANPVAVGLIGAWTANVRFDNAVNRIGAASMGDLYSRMTVNFSSCFDVGDLCQFTVDTDIIN